jgi:type IV secretion system protein VirD4
MRAPTAPAAVPPTPGAGVFPWVVGIFGDVVNKVWAGAALAGAASGSPGRVTFTAAGRALLRLPTRLADPASAWPRPAADSLPGPVAYWGCQLAVLTVTVGLGVVGWRLWQRLGSDGPRPFGVDPEAGFASPRHLARLAVRSPAPGRVTIGRSRGRLIATEVDTSLAVVGPTGCGKTAGFAIPAILEWTGPVLATSVKADLLDATIAHRKKRGTVWVYDPTTCSGHLGSTWSPLAACRTWAGAMRVAAWMAEAAQPRFDTVSEGDYWYSQARKGLAPYLHAAAVTAKPIGTLVRWIDSQERDEVEAALVRSSRVDIGTGEILDAESTGARWQELFDASVDIARGILAKQAGEAADLAGAPLDQWPEWLVQRVTDTVQIEWAAEQADAGGGDRLAPLTAAKALWGKESRLRGSVFATIENVLAGWADPMVTAAATGCEIDLDTWLSGDHTLYVVATAHEQARLRPVLTVLVQQAIRRAYDTAAATKGRLAHPCLVLLDEAGNTAPLRDLPGYASTARSHAITLVTVWQDLAQIKAAYADRAQTVLNNHRAKLFGAGIADADTLEYVSKLIGDQARTERNLSADLAGARRSISEHRTYRRSAPVDVVRRIPPGEAVLLYGSELPAHVRLRPWFADRGLRSLVPPEPVVTTRRSARALLHR